MGNVVRLSVHKNTLYKRVHRKCSANLRAAVATITRAEGTAGYVLVAWNRRGVGTVSMDNNDGVIEAEALPDWVRREIAKRL